MCSHVPAPGASPCTGVLEQCHTEQGEQQDTGKTCVISQGGGSCSKGSSYRRTSGFRHPYIPLKRPGQAAQSGMGKREQQWGESEPSKPKEMCDKPQSHLLC